jgi:hypothetical protein
MKTSEWSYIVVAHHHGAFLTLRSLFDAGIKWVNVIVPTSQLKKYSTFPDDISKNFYKNLVKFVGRRGIVHERTYTYPELITNVTDYADSVNMHGNVMVLGAGSVYKKDPPSEGTCFLFDYPYSRGQFNMYEMIGSPSGQLAKDMFQFKLQAMKPITDDGWVQRNRNVGPWTFMRPDPLIGEALSVQECLRFYTRTKLKASAYNFWMQCLQPEQKPEQLLAYPFAEYAALAKKVKKYIHPGTFNRIVAHAKDAAYWAEIKDLDL